jgi:hypothetical protein
VESRIPNVNVHDFTYDVLDLSSFPGFKKQMREVKAASLKRKERPLKWFVVRL